MRDMDHQPRPCRDPAFAFRHLRLRQKVAFPMKSLAARNILVPRISETQRCAVVTAAMSVADHEFGDLAAFDPDKRVLTVFSCKADGVFTADAQREKARLWWPIADLANPFAW